LSVLDAKRSLPPPERYESPRFAMPRGACDAHTHVIPSHATLAAHAAYTPAPAPFAAHRGMLRALGVERAVVVQPSIFGSDNGAIVAAIAQAPEFLRGVAVVEADVSDAALGALHRQGIRGLRFNPMLGGSGLDAMRALAPRIAAVGWHAELLVDGQRLPELEATLLGLPCRLVIDHLASLPAEADTAAAPCRTLCRLLGERDTWIKLSGAYRLAADAADHRLAARAQMLYAAAPQRVVWGSDWPHVACATMPDAGALLNLLADWFERDAGVLQRILADNPARLFDFPARTGDPT
jgi:2-pyrone-4,6-dicarboxylate lactonase